MAMNVELREKPRVFEVWIGENSIGEVISYADDTGDEGSEELYEAFLYEGGVDDGHTELGWHKTLREAAQTIIEYTHGEGKIDAIKKRKV